MKNNFSIWLIGPVDIPFDKPLNNDLVVDTEKRKPEEIALEIINKIKFLN